MRSGMTVAEVLRLGLDKNYNPTPALLRWLDARQIEHNGKLDGEDGIIEATQRRQPQHADGRLKSRTEINVAEEDSIYSSEGRRQRIQLLRDLGLFYTDYAAPQGTIDVLLIHASYFLELLLMRELLIKCGRSGLRWRKMIYLGAEFSVGEDRPLDQLIEIATHRRRHMRELHNIWDWSSLRWYAPNAQIFGELWRNLPLPEDMEALRAVEVQLISAPDGKHPNGERRLANTQDTLTELERVHVFNRSHSHTVVTVAPVCLRQWRITSMWLDKHLPHCALDVLCAHHAGPVSPTLADREYTNSLWEEERNRQRLLNR